jgi:hypothetical protein
VLGLDNCRLNQGLIRQGMFEVSETGLIVKCCHLGLGLVLELELVEVLAVIADMLNYLSQNRILQMVLVLV